jgi:transposase InsO family protein
MCRVESFVPPAEYESMPQSDRQLAEYFAYDNSDRKHSTNGYRTPVQFETQLSGQS